MKLVCFDNNVLVWGIRGFATPGQEVMISRAKALIKKLTESGTNVLVPSLVMAEFLMPVPPSEHGATIS